MVPSTLIMREDEILGVIEERHRRGSNWLPARAVGVASQSGAYNCNR